MTGVRLQYIRLEIRKWISYMKRRFLRACFVLFLLILLLGGCYLRLQGSGEQTAIQVALVVPGEQEEVTQLAKLLQHMESVRSLLTFVYPGEEALDELFESGKIQAAILFSEDFYEDVNTGVNTPITIRLKEKYPGANLFRELLTSVVTLVDVTEAASYAMIDTFYEQDAEMSLTAMENQILEDNVELLFQIRDQISMQIVSPTGEINMVQYYVAVVFFLFLLLSGLGFWSLYDPANRLAEAKLCIYGVGRMYRSICKIMLMTLVVFGHALVGFGICRLVCQYAEVYVAGWDSDLLLALLLFSLFVSCLYHGIFLMSGEKNERRVILFLLFAILLIAGGCVVPCAYLPTWVGNIAKMTPFYIFRSYMEAVLFGNNISYSGILVWSLLFLTIGGIFSAGMATRLSGSKEYKEARVQFVRAISKSTKKEWWFRIYLYLKWQWKRKSPVIIWGCGIALILLCVNIHFPRQENRTILISGEAGVCREIEDNFGKNSTFEFEYEPDERVCEKMVKSGQVLASVEFSDEEIVMNTCAVSPEVLVAKETVAVAYYQYAQRELLKKECIDVFGTEQIYDRVFDTFDQYMKNENLFRVEYQME